MVFLAVYLFTTFFLQFQPCFTKLGVVLNANSLKSNQDIESIIRKYIHPLKHISAKFPNHEVQLQIEFEKKKPRHMPVNMKQPRVVYYQPMKQQHLTPYEHYRRRHSKKSKRIRSKEESEETEKETTKPTEPSTTAVNDPSQKPLTMNDLKKVLDEFGQRFFTLAGGNPNTATPSMFDFQSPPTGQINGKNIEELISTLEKGLNLAKNLQFPADDNIEWVRVKVPK